MQSVGRTPISGNPKRRIKTMQKTDFLTPTDTAGQTQEGLPAKDGSHPPCPERFEMGDKRRFHWRRCDQWINGVSQEQYEVYSIGLETWAICYLPTEAAAVADGLELLYANDKLTRAVGE